MTKRNNSRLGIGRHCTSYCVMASVICMACIAGDAFALTVSGVIKDENGTALKGLLVRVMDKDVFLDSEIATVCTNASGTYSANFDSDQDIYVVVEYRKQLTGPLANGKFAFLDDCGVTEVSTVDKTNGYHEDANANIVINIRKNAAADTVAVSIPHYISLICAPQEELDVFVAEGITSVAIGAQELDLDPRYFWRVRAKDSTGKWGHFSAFCVFETK